MVEGDDDEKGANSNARESSDFLTEASIAALQDALWEYYGIADDDGSTTGNSQTESPAYVEIPLVVDASMSDQIHQGNFPETEWSLDYYVREALSSLHGYEFDIEFSGGDDSHAFVSATTLKSGRPCSLKLLVRQSSIEIDMTLLDYNFLWSLELQRAKEWCSKINAPMHEWGNKPTAWIQRSSFQVVGDHSFEVHVQYQGHMTYNTASSPKNGSALLTALSSEISAGMNELFRLDEDFLNLSRGSLDGLPNPPIDYDVALGSESYFD